MGLSTGTRLNELRCFRQTRTYTRKRIAKVRLLPDGTASKFRPGQVRRSRDRPVTLDRDQRSVEMARLSYSECPEKHAEGSVACRRIKNRDTCVETELVFGTKPVVETERVIGVDEKTPKKVSLEVNKKNLPESEEKGSFDSSNKYSGSQSETSFWLRFETVRKIINFFGSLLGREVTKREQTRHQRGKTRSRDAKRSQVPRTIILERQMRKLEEENRRYKEMLDDKMNKGRRLSSPLH